MTLRSAARAERWWLTGTERCPFCERLYAWEIEQRCIHCDRPMCSVCATTVRRSGDRFCPDCCPTGR